MDIRTFGQTQRTLRRENSRLQAENERLRNELAAMESYWRNAESLSETLRAELGQCISENNQLTENAAKLGKALDMALAERDQAYRDLDAQTLKSNSFMRELHRYMQHAIELKDMLDASVANREELRADLDNERNAHNATAAQLYAKLDAQAKRHADVIERWKVEENTWHEFDKEQLTQIAALRAELAGAYDTVTAAALAWRTVTDERDALRAELDAMRQAHSVIAARMEAMGC